MKLDIAELPKIRELLEALQQNAWIVEQLSRPMAAPTTEFQVEDREHNEMHTITHGELLGIFHARVDALSKSLLQRYQIDFTKANLFASQPAVPILPADPAPTSVDDVDVTNADRASLRDAGVLR